jgi:hypothetical protein
MASDVVTLETTSGEQLGHETSTRGTNSDQGLSHKTTGGEELGHETSTRGTSTGEEFGHETTSGEEFRQVLADMQRGMDQMQQQNSLLELAVLHLLRGKWDAASHGPQSAEAALVACNPGLQGKVHAVPFDMGR